MTVGGVYGGHVLNFDITPLNQMLENVKFFDNSIFFGKVQNFRENILEIFKKIIDNYEWQVLSLAQG